jgi:hypothetical protein
MHMKKHQFQSVLGSMHIHPSMSEVVQRAFSNLMEVDTYHHHIRHLYGIDYALEL